MIDGTMVSIYHPVGILTKKSYIRIETCIWLCNRWYPQPARWRYRALAPYSLLISAERLYETHDAELLAIIEAFKTWLHYLERSRHKGPRPYRPQQSSPIHGYKETESPAGQLGSLRVISTLFSNWLLYSWRLEHVGITTVMLPLLKMHMLYDVWCDTIVKERVLSHVLASLITMKIQNNR